MRGERESSDNQTTSMKSQERKDAQVIEAAPFSITGFFLQVSESRNFSNDDVENFQKHTCIYRCIMQMFDL